MEPASQGRKGLDMLLGAATLGFYLMGMTSSLLYFAGAIACLGAAIALRPGNGRRGAMVGALAVLYFLVVFAYGVGKDMAVRDNKLGAAAMPNYGVSIHVRMDQPAAVHTAQKQCAKRAALS